MKPVAWPLVVAAALLTLLIYGPRLDAPLIWDDRIGIAFNHTYEKPIPLKNFFTPAYFDIAPEELSWRPLSTLSYYEIIRHYGKSPNALRGFSLFLHLMNGLILLVILKAWGFREDVSAFAVALFWVHPAHAETLMCAEFNKELLVALGLLAMIAAHQRRRWGLASLGFASALLSKEAGAAGLFLAVLYDLCDGGIRQCRARLRDYTLYAGVFAAYAILRFKYLSGPGSGPSVSLAFSERIYHAFGGWITAVRTFLFPVALRIEYFALPPESTQAWLMRVTLGIVLTGIVLASAYYLWEKNRKLAFFFLWPLPFLFITSNLVPAGALSMRIMAERWLYLPILGWVVVLAGPLINRNTHGIRIALIAVISFWSMQALLNAEEWSDEIRLWSSLARAYPWSAKAEEGLGEAYFRSDRYTEALSAFERARAVRESRSDKVLAHYIPIAHGQLSWEKASVYRWLGRCEAALGHIPKADADFQRATSLEPNDPVSYLFMTYSSAKKGDFTRARKWLTKGLRRNPKDKLLLQLKPQIQHRRLQMHIAFG